MRRIVLFPILIFIALCTGAGAALAQATDPTATPPPPEAAPAAASSGRSGLGVGVAAMMFGGPNGGQVAYDAGLFHIEGIVGVMSPGQERTNIGIGARFWYHLHSTANADFSLGGGVGYLHRDTAPDEDNDTVHIDAGAQIRAFLLPNIALSATLGVALVTAEQSAFLFGGQYLGGLGLTYFFF